MNHLLPLFLCFESYIYYMWNSVVVLLQVKDFIFNIFVFVVCMLVSLLPVLTNLMTNYSSFVDNLLLL